MIFYINQKSIHSTRYFKKKDKKKDFKDFIFY